MQINFYTYTHITANYSNVYQKTCRGRLHTGHICVYVCVRTNICIPTYTYKNMHAYIHIYAYTHTYTLMYTKSFACTYGHTYSLAVQTVPELLAKGLVDDAVTLVGAFSLDTEDLVLRMTNTCLR